MFPDDPEKRYYGKHRGVVAEVAGAKAAGQLRAKVPRLLGREVTGWAWPALPYAGPDRGQYAVPPVGAGVWIEFEEGLLSKPIWTGCWWPDGDAPSPDGSEPDPDAVVIRAGDKLGVSLDPARGEARLGSDETSDLITVDTKAGTVTIQAAAKVVIVAPTVELGRRATHPVVHGDALLAYLGRLTTALQSHVHAGQVAGGNIPVTPMVPSTVFEAPPANLTSTTTSSA